MAIRSTRTTRTARVSNSAITLLELLVVLAVLGVLLAIILPAVQRAREAARRAQCVNNLKQIGLALHAYHSTWRMFPSGQSDWTSGHDGPRGYSAFARLLESLGEVAVFNSINFDLGQDLEPPPIIQNTTAAITRIAGFLCPSDQNAGVGPYGGTCYRVSAGLEFQTTAPVRIRQRSKLGAFVYAEWLSARDFSDGLSATIGISEKLRGDDNPSSFRADSDMRYIPDNGASQGLDEVVQTCSAAEGDPPGHHSQGGYSWMLSHKVCTWYEHALTPNTTVNDCSLWFPASPVGWTVGILSARSHHTGGVNCLFMDGTVRFETDSIDLTVWRALSTRGGGERVDSTY